MTSYWHDVRWAQTALVVGPGSPASAATAASSGWPGGAPRGGCNQVSSTADCTGSGTASTVGVQVESTILLDRR